ncbi:MAG: alpha/beta hydrolase fold domain-containing protein [Eubacterium sp.]|nr:alpha/beta hydrolase fold domain-containing protein [Eubacterium sp.]
MSKLSGLKKKTADEIYAEVRRRKDAMSKVDIDSWTAQGISVKKEMIKDTLCLFLMPTDNFNGVYIYYIYDSDYSFPINREEFDFAAYLAVETGMCICMPMYPLAPEKRVGDVFDSLTAVYDNLLHKKNIPNIIMAGTGVGAGLAMSLTLEAWKTGFRAPDKLILLSPELDAEFFDKKLENTLLSQYYNDGIFFSEAKKEYINKYWVGEYAARTEYTSPIYEDIRDLCNQLIIVSGTEDIFNCYARELADKAENAGLNVSFFEFPRMHHKFFHDDLLDEAQHARKVILDLITDSTDRIINQYMYEIKERSEFSKQYPEIFKDREATKYLVNNHISYEKYKRNSDYINLVKAATYKSFDDEVRKFILQYPNGTVVYLGCSLDTMFKRMDNGRVNWYNLDTPGMISIRRLYTRDGEREHTIVKSIDDMSWLDDIKCDIGFGLLFVCRDFFQYKNSKEVSAFIDKLYHRFQGAQIVFNAPNHMAMIANNRYSKRNDVDYKKYRLYIKDPVRDISLWNVAYEVINAASVFNNINPSKKWKTMMRLRFRYNAIKETNKIIRLRMGAERYQIFRDGQLIKV